ncbi:MAG: hypothetical protein ACREF9_05495, partial [Opitutaceae bacterium]
MKTSRSTYVLATFLAALAFVPAAVAQARPGQAARGETTVQLDVGFGIRAVLPSRVTVPAGETLRIIAPDLD